MAIADVSGFPVAAHIESASPHEVKLVEETIDSSYTEYAIDRIIEIKRMTAISLIKGLLKNGALRRSPLIR